MPKPRIPKDEAIHYLETEIFLPGRVPTSKEVGAALRAKFLPNTAGGREADRALGATYVKLFSEKYPGRLAAKSTHRGQAWALSQKAHSGGVTAASDDTVRARTQLSRAPTEAQGPAPMTWEEACAKSAYFQALELHAVQNSSSAVRRRRDTAKLAFQEAQRLVSGKAHLDA